MYLYRRNAMYYFRVRVPKQISTKCFLNEIRYSLKTTSKTKAKSMASFLYFKTDILFRKIKEVKNMSFNQRNDFMEFLQQYFEKSIKEYSELEDKRHQDYTFFDSNGIMHKGHTPEAIDNAKYQIQEIIKRYDFEEMRDKAFEILDRVDFDKTQLTNLSKKEQEIFYAKLLKKEIEVLQYDKDRNIELLEGKSKENISLLNKISDALKTQDTSEDTNFLNLIVNQVKQKNIDKLSKTPKSEKLFSQLKDTFLKNERQAKKWTIKTFSKASLALKNALEIMGDKDISLYTREDFEYFRSVLLTLPSNYKKKKEYQDKTIVEASNICSLKIQNGEKIKVLSDSSVNDMIGWLHTFIKWCYIRGYIEKNLAIDLKVKKDTASIDEKLPFDEQDLKEIKEHILSKALKQIDKKPAHYWLVLIGLYNGFRLEEIAQLHVEDIYQKDGIWVFDINDRPNKNGEKVKSVKNNPSKRVVPIHPKLIELGFIKYYEKVKEMGFERVWYMLNKNKHGFGRNPSRWFNEQVKKYLTNSDKKTFHSTRHTFIQSCKNISMDPYKRRALTGRGEKEMDYVVYGEKFSVKILYEELKKINYPSLES